MGKKQWGSSRLSPISHLSFGLYSLAEGWATRQTMLTFNRLLSIAFLSSACLFAPGRSASDLSDIALGLAQFETLTVTENVGKHSPYIVVRVTNQRDKVQSFGLSNEAGVLGMPLPPGKYCYEAFSQSGHHLKMNRPEPERCFEVKKGEVVEVGVGFKP
jgi:hypothetical protein